MKKKFLFSTLIAGVLSASMVMSAFADGPSGTQAVDGVADGGSIEVSFTNPSSYYITIPSGSIKVDRNLGEQNLINNGEMDYYVQCFQDQDGNKLKLEVHHGTLLFNERVKVGIAYQEGTQIVQESEDYVGLLRYGYRTIRYKLIDTGTAWDNDKNVDEQGNSITWTMNEIASSDLYETNSFLYAYSSEISDDTSNNTSKIFPVKIAIVKGDYDTYIKGNIAGDYSARLTFKAEIEKSEFELAGDEILNAAGTGIDFDKVKDVHSDSNIEWAYTNFARGIVAGYPGAFAILGPGSNANQYYVALYDDQYNIVNTTEMTIDAINTSYSQGNMVFYVPKPAN